MSHPKLVVVLATTLILISLLDRAVPSTSAAPGRSGLETREQEQIDAYIQARIQAAHIPGLALGVVRGNQITRAGGTAMPHRYGIRVKGLLDPSWSAWFDGLTITHEGVERLFSSACCSIKRPSTGFSGKPASSTCRWSSSVKFQPTRRTMATRLLGNTR